MLQRFGVEQREVLCRLSEPRQNKKDALCMDLKPEAGKGSIHLAGGTGWPEPLTSEWGEEVVPPRDVGSCLAWCVGVWERCWGAGCTRGKAGRVLEPQWAEESTVWWRRLQWSQESGWAHRRISENGSQVSHCQTGACKHGKRELECTLQCWLVLELPAWTHSFLDRQTKRYRYKWVRITMYTYTYRLTYSP